MAALRGPNLSAVTDSALLILGDQLAAKNRLRQFTYIVESVHEERGLATGFIVVLRDRLAGSPFGSARAVASDVNALLSRLQEDFVQKQLGDPSPIVRSAALRSLEGVNKLDRLRAVAIVREHLASEQHRSSVAVGLEALAALIREQAN